MAPPLVEGGGYAPILPRVEGEDAHAATGHETVGQLPQQRLEGRQFIVHRNAQGLEGATDRSLDLGAGERQPRGLEPEAHASLERVRCCHWCAGEQVGYQAGVRFVGMVLEQLREGGRVERGQPLGRGAAPRRVEAHVERTDAGEVKPARLVVEMHLRDAQVDEQRLCPRHAALLHRVREVAEGRVSRGHPHCGRCAGLQARSRHLQGLRIEIKRHQVPAGGDQRQQRRGMTPAAEGRIDDDIARGGMEAAQHLGAQQRAVGTVCSRRGTRLAMARHGPGHACAGGRKDLDAVVMTG